MATDAGWIVRFWHYVVYAGRVFFWTESEFIDARTQLLFTMLITVHFVVIVLHDLLDIPGWTNGTNVREVVGRKKLWFAATINACFPDGGCVCNLRVERAATRICCELLCGNSSGPTTTSLSRARS